MPKTKEELDRFISEQRFSDCFKDLPLEGKRVLDLSTVIAAPYAATLLGDAGAEVIKIENPKAPDDLRTWGVIKEQRIQPYHSVIGRNKLPVTINLKSETGKRIFIELIQSADVLIENMRVGVMEKLGLSHSMLLEANPGLVIGKVSGYGMTGPHAKQPGFGTLAEAFSGFTYLNGHHDSGPTCPPNALADLTTGVHLAYAISLCLHQAERNVKGGQVIDMSLYEPLFGYLGAEFLTYKLTGQVPQPFGNELRAAAPRNVYKTRDERWIAMSCSSQKTWEALAHVMGQKELIHDSRFLTNSERIQPGNRMALNQIIQQWLITITEAEALTIFRNEGITAGPVMSMKCIDEDNHYQERGSFITLKDPATGTELKMPNVPFRLGNKTPNVRFPGLPCGAANRVVLSELLGYSDETIAQLKNTNAI